MRRFFKILRNLVLGVVGLLLLLVALVNLSPVQDFLAHQAAQVLAKKLRTTVRVGHVRIDFLNHVRVQDLLVLDRQGDTLLRAGEVRVRITDWFLFRKEVPVLRYIGLHDAAVHLYRTRRGPDWNYQFIADAFDTGKKDSTKKQNEFELDLERLDIQRVRFYMDDAWAGSDNRLDVGSLQLDADEIDLKKRRAVIHSLEATGVTFFIRDYAGGRAKQPRRTGPAPVDTTAFNPGRWALSAGNLQLRECRFKLESGTKPPLDGLFDTEHMDIQHVALDARSVRINGDTLTAALKHLAVVERCGLRIKHLGADVTVSPVLSECKNLRLETNGSVLGDYYAMRYRRFPDFEDYIERVRMVAQLKGAHVAVQDIAYFAPALKGIQKSIRLSGAFDGTVARFATRNLDLAEGASRLRGDLAMTGLPDIDRTVIAYKNGMLSTTGLSVLSWVPSLRNHPALALERLQYAAFNGDFAGTIAAFAAKGTLRTNLGTIVSDVRLKLPPSAARNAAYEGTIRTKDFAVGPLLRVPYLGRMTFEAKIDGIGFDPRYAQVLIDARADRLEAYGYSYRNITANGVLARKRFEGKGQVDDPNLALAFDGSLDFSGPEPLMAAKAYLLKSDFKALGFTRDSLTATADFDVATSGLNPDQFLGTAKLFNINVARNGTRLDLDSIALQASRAPDGSRQLDVSSNALTAQLAGRFRLTDLPVATQYYLAGYLPNYIKIRRREPPEQDLTFNIVTRRADELLGVLVPGLRGFDSSTITGSLQTASQRLTLDAKVPFGQVSTVRFQGVDLQAAGDFHDLTVKATAAGFSVGNGLFNAAVDLNATVGADSLTFSVATTSSDIVGTATLRGMAYARGDTLYGSLSPSEFAFNDDRWEIAGGNQITLATDYLRIRDLRLQSGLQRIAIASSSETTDQALQADIQNLDLSRLSGLAGLASYAPDGRADGTVRVENLFKKSLQVTSDLRVNMLKLGADTVGDVVLVGRYDGATGSIQLDPRTGIFRGPASLTVSGTLAADSTNTNQSLNGTITLSDAPLAWVAPFAVGSVSNLAGTLRGSVAITGTAARPNASGNVTLHDASMRVDYIGTTYRIPFANLALKANQIDVGSIVLYDRFGNSGTITGTISHRNFSDLRFALDLNTTKLELLNLRDFENAVYYGDLVASAQVTFRGTADNLQMNVLRGTPVEAGHLYLPIGSTGGGTGSYSFVSFRNYGTNADAGVKRGSKLRFSLNLDILANPLVQVSLILDPATGDAINARGSGSVRLELPSGSDARMFGNYLIESGDYTFTLQQVFFQRKFTINSGSTISFSGPITQTKLNVEAVYPTYARLYDLLSERQVEAIPNASELDDAKANQRVDLLLRMRGSLVEPDLSFDIDLPERRSIGTVAEAELRRIRQNERELFDQVASLLLIGTFVPTQGIVSGTAARSGAINNVSELLSTNISGQLTNIINKLLGDNKIALDLKYKNYNLADAATEGGIANRNQVKLGVRRNFFNDRLILEVGSAYDWGRPVGNATRSNFNPVGDFRLQYLLNDEGRLRLNIFRTSNFDVLVNDNISRSGAGLSYRKTFDSFDEFIHGRRHAQQLLLQQPAEPTPAPDTARPTGSTTAGASD